MAFVLDLKVSGHYLYYDSNNFGEGAGDDFYDTVYVLTPDPMPDGSYLVYSIVYNYDGEHDVKPYTIVGNGWDYEADEIFTISLTSLSYPFSDTVREFFIDHIMNIYALEEQDSIFELYKSTMQFGFYPMLFAEARRETYTRAWEVFGERMWDDFWEQTMMISIAMTIGGILKCIPFTTAIAGAAFMLTYTILMKYFMDEKAAVAASEEAAQKFYTLGSREAIQLNDRMIADRVSRDSSLAAIQGHPAAYYTLIHGGPTGHDYTAEVIASPPNEMRTSRATLGMAAYVATLGQIPELFFGLDFDYSNIDYEQFTTALYTYNDYPFYTYYHKGLFGIPKMSDPYQYNTLGYVEQKVTGASTAMNAIFGDAEPILDEIRPVSYDGAVRYVFEKRSHTSPVSPLFQPIVLSEPRYNFLEKLGMVSPGHLGITVKHMGSIGTLGMNPYGLTTAESLHYGAKIPLAFNKTFGYPIISVSLAVKHGLRTIDTITIPEDMYEVKGGDLFITTSLEDLAKTSDKYNAFVGSDAESIPHNMYYTIEVTFHRFVPFSAEYEGLALAQVGHYAVMDQVHQYTFAEISSNMIAEIGYTEVLTLMTTLASAPAMIFYSYASFKAEQAAGTTVLEKFSEAIHSVLFEAFIKAPISEMIEELTIDIILEGLIEGYLREWGYSDNFGQWCSLIATSVREGVSLSNRIDSSIKHKSKAKFDLEAKVGKIESQLESQDINSEQKQKLQEEKLGLESEIAALQQKIEKKQAIRDALKLTTSLLYAAATMGFGGFSLGGMSNLISTSYDQFVKEPLKRAISGNSKLKTIAKREMQTSKKMGRALELMNDLHPDSKKYKDVEKAYYHLIYERNQLNAMIEQMSKASDISQDTNPDVAKKTSSITTSQQDTDVSQKLDSWKDEFHKHYQEYGVYEETSIERAMTIQEYLASQNLDPSYVGVLVDGTQETDPTTIITPENELVVMPILAGGADQHRIMQVYNKLEELDRFSGFELERLEERYEGHFIEEKPKHITKLSWFLKYDLHLSDNHLVTSWDVYVNGEKIEYYNQPNIKVTPQDTVMVSSRMGIMEKIHDIERSILAVPSDKRIFSEISEISPEDIQFLDAVYAQLDGLYVESNFEEGMSPYTPHFLVFRDRLIKFVEDYNIIDLNGKTRTQAEYEVSKVMTPSGTETAIETKLSKLRSGDHFDLFEDTLFRWYVELEEEIYTKLGGTKQDYALTDLKVLFTNQLKLYGHLKKNPLYFDARITVYKIARMLYSTEYYETKENSKYSYNVAYKSGFPFAPKWFRFNNPHHIPNKGTWLGHLEKIENRLIEKGADSMDLVIILGNVKILLSAFEEKVKLRRNFEEIFKDTPESERKQLLRDIVNCPYTDVLQRIDNQIILSRLLFNHPVHDYRTDRTCYIGRYFTESLDAITSIYFSIIAQTSHLTVQDFKSLNLEISEAELKLLQSHIRDTVFEHMWQEDYFGRGYISHKVANKYGKHSRELMRAYFEFFCWYYTAAGIYQKSLDSKVIPQFIPLDSLENIYANWFSEQDLPSTRSIKKLFAELMSWRRQGIEFADQALYGLIDFAHLQERLSKKAVSQPKRFTNAKKSFIAEIDSMGNVQRVPYGLSHLEWIITEAIFYGGGFSSKIAKYKEFHKSYRCSLFSKGSYTMGWDDNSIYYNYFPKFQKEVALMSWKTLSEDPYVSARLDQTEKLRRLRTTLESDSEKLKLINELANPQGWPSYMITGYGQPHHKWFGPVVFHSEKLKAAGVNVIVADQPISIINPNTGELITGHPDFIIQIGKRIYICDYKPDLDFNFESDKITNHIVDSVPQVAPYGVIFKKNNLQNLIDQGFEVYCYTFNKEGGVIYDPIDATRSIVNFLSEFRDDLYLPFGFLADLFDTGTIFNPNFDGY